MWGRAANQTGRVYRNTASDPWEYWSQVSGKEEREKSPPAPCLSSAIWARRQADVGSAVGSVWQSLFYQRQENSSIFLPLCSVVRRYQSSRSISRRGGTLLVDVSGAEHVKLRRVAMGWMKAHVLGRRKTSRSSADNCYATNFA